MPGLHEGTGTVLTVAAGKCLIDAFDRAGFDKTDLFITNSIHCHPPDDRDPLRMRLITAQISCAPSCETSSGPAW